MKLINKLVETYLNSSDSNFKRDNHDLWILLLDIQTKEDQKIPRCPHCNVQLEDVL